MSLDTWNTGSRARPCNCALTADAAEFGAAAPPTDVDTTGSSPERDPEPEDPTPPEGWTQIPYVQVEGGFVAGVSLGLVPFGGVGQQVLDAAEVLPHGTPEARRGLAVGQIVGGMITLVGGLTGEVAGGLAAATGVGAPVGVPAVLASSTLVVGGLGNIAAGIWGLTQALSTGSGGGSNGTKSTAGGDRAGQAFTPKGKRQVVDENRARNSGTTRCEGCETQTVPGQQSQKGVTPPPNETNVDHIIPRAHGGQGSPVNGQVLCRTCNNKKSDKMP